MSKQTIDIEKLASGDERAFKTLFDAMFGDLVQSSAFYTEDLHAAEDIVQEVFIQLWENRKQIATIRNVEDYLFTCVKNKSLNHVRHLQTVERRMQDYPCSELDEDGEEKERLEEYLGRLEKLLEQLPEKRKQVLRLSVVESKSYAEIATALDISLNTVKDHIKKAYAFLRNGLQDNISPTLLLIVLCGMKHRLSNQPRQ